MKRAPLVKRIIVVVTLALVPLAPLPALASGEIAGATFPEQIVQEITATSQLARQAQEVQTQIQQYENMVQNMANIPSQLMGQMQGSFDQLINLENTAQGLSTQAQNIASQFQNLNASAASSSEMENYIQNYQQISQNLSNTINNALQQANLNPSNFATVAQAQQAVSQALQDTNSRNALLQAGAEVSQAEVTQLAQLQQTVAAQTNLQASIAKNHLAAGNANQEANAEAQQALYGNPDSSTSGVVVGGGTLNALSNALGGN
ncbi:conjugal transfer protein TrbJ [Acidithiobacillus ferrooxidans]|uniref:conjugal transfer protein TrbJ n=1 Tax=Acidithiobacillus TaxID=119977 RepID=UPI000ADD485E|nr:conjugal transfer protein TrbJ [Acidithiobacillus ferridurans]MBU2803641.1 conjugal transfer protein TrbJ [Acidithiobacillus ferridurans]